MSTCKITYNGNEISSVDETAPVSVAYNSATIATLNDGDTKTLGCHGKVMSSDVVIGSKTLNCNGKLMQGDIVVELVGSATSGETWYFNDTVGSISSIIGVGVKELYVNFTSNGVSYTMMRNITIVEGKFHYVNIMQYYNSDTEAFANVYRYDINTWYNEAYRTLVLDEPATGDVLAFLEANATKLS